MSTLFLRCSLVLECSEAECELEERTDIVGGCTSCNGSEVLSNEVGPDGVILFRVAQGTGRRLLDVHLNNPGEKEEQEC